MSNCCSGKLPDLNTKCSPNVGAHIKSSILMNPETGECYDMKGRSIGKGVLKDGILKIQYYSESKKE